MIVDDTHIRVCFPSVELTVNSEVHYRSCRVWTLKFLKVPSETNRFLITFNLPSTI